MNIDLKTVYHPVCEEHINVRAREGPLCIRRITQENHIMKHLTLTHTLTRNFLRNHFNMVVK